MNVKVEQEEIHIKEEGDPIPVLYPLIQDEPEGNTDTLTVVPGLCSKTDVQYSDVISMKVEEKKVHMKEEDDPIVVLDPLIQDEPEDSRAILTVPSLCSKTDVQYSDVMNVKVEQEQIHIKEEDDPIAVLDPLLQDEPESIPNEQHAVCVEGHPNNSAVYNKEYNEQYETEVHQHSHSAQLPHTCDICNKSFSSKSVLKRHHQRTHSGGRPYSCDACNNVFNKKNDLKRHQIIHNGVHLYVCNVCNRTFSKKGNLKRHQSIHCEERQYVCNMCNRGFSRNDILKRHQSVHSGGHRYVCSVCNRGFSQKGSYKRHQSTKCGAHQYVCNVCNRKFIDKFRLKRHHLIHSGERPYACDVCNKNFRYKSSVKKHHCKLASMHIQIYEYTPSHS